MRTKRFSRTPRPLGVMGRAEMQKIIGTMTSQAPDETVAFMPLERRIIWRTQMALTRREMAMALARKPLLLPKWRQESRERSRSFALGNLSEPMAGAREAFGEAAPKGDAEDDAGPREHEEDEKGREGQLPVTPEEAGVGDHHHSGKEEHGPEAEEAVNKDGDDGLGFFVVGFAGGVKGLDDVAAGGAEEEGIEELGDESDAGGATPGEAQPLDLRTRRQRATLRRIVNRTHSSDPARGRGRPG